MSDADSDYAIALSTYRVKRSGFWFGVVHDGGSW